MDKNISPLIKQLIILSIVIGVSIAVLAAAGLFRTGSEEGHLVTYRVGGTTSTAVITYTAADGVSTDTFESAVPWKKSIRYPKTTIVILTAGNPTQTGSIECQLLLDGKVWKSNSTKMPGDKVSCAGIVP